MDRDEELYEARRTVLQSLITHRFSGSQADFAAASGISASYITRMLKDVGHPSRKRIGDDIARKLENIADMGLTPGQMLNPIDPVTTRVRPMEVAERLTKDEEELLALFRRIGSATTRGRVLGYLDGLVDKQSSATAAPVALSRKQGKRAA